MYEQTFFNQQITRFEQEQLERAAEQRRFLIEHADQIVPRPEGPIRRMLRRIFRSGADAAGWPAENVSTPNGRGVRARTASSRAENARAAAGCGTAGCEPTVASAR